MIKLNVNNLLRQTGNSVYWLAKETGISQNNMSKICNGETVNIRLETMDKLCNVLDCNPGDLFTYTKNSIK